MPLRKTAWQEAAWLFVLSRVILLFLTVITIVRIPLASQGSSRSCMLDLTSCLLSWDHYDVLAYTGIAQYGYVHVHDTVFFPLWPLLIRGLGILFGATALSYYFSSLVLANLFFYLALVVCFYVLSKEFDEAVARKACFYLTFSPYALFFFTGYTESLFVLLSLATFLCLQSGRWWLAGGCGFLAALTRSQGILLMIPFAVVLWLHFQVHREDVSWERMVQAALPLLLIPLGVVVFMGYLAITKGDPLAFSTQEAVFWHRHLVFPPVSIIMTFQALLRPETYNLHLLNSLDVIFVLLALVILALGWKRLPLHYSLFALALLLFCLSYPQGTIEPLAAGPRYVLVIFPLFAVLGMWGKQPRLDSLITACSLTLFAINALLFINHYWVA
jgi:Gpi18-like mannosyltransferase